jgi:hypothetical protein
MKKLPLAPRVQCTTNSSLQRSTFETAFSMASEIRLRKSKRPEEPRSLSPKDTCQLAARVLPDAQKCVQAPAHCFCSHVVVFGSADPSAMLHVSMVPGSYDILRSEDGGFHWMHGALDPLCAAWRHGDSFTDVRASLVDCPKLEMIHFGVGSHLQLIVDRDPRTKASQRTADHLSWCRKPSAAATELPETSPFSMCDTSFPE